jgi:hypothetical protein
MPHGDLVAASRHHASVAVVAELFALVRAGRPMAALPPWADAGAPA